MQLIKLWGDSCHTAMILNLETEITKQKYFCSCYKIAVSFTSSKNISWGKKNHYLKKLFFSKGDMFAIQKAKDNSIFLNQTLFFSSGKCILLASLNKKKTPLVSNWNVWFLYDATGLKLHVC